MAMTCTDFRSKFGSPSFHGDPWREPKLIIPVVGPFVNAHFLRADAPLEPKAGRNVVSTAFRYTRQLWNQVIFFLITIQTDVAGSPRPPAQLVPGKRVYRPELCGRFQQQGQGGHQAILRLSHL